MDDQLLTCIRCGAPASHQSNHGSWCCACHVRAGNPPADWHPGCMATYRELHQVVGDDPEAVGPMPDGVSPSPWSLDGRYIFDGRGFVVGTCQGHADGLLMLRAPSLYAACRDALGALRRATRGSFAGVEVEAARLESVIEACRKAAR